MSGDLRVLLGLKNTSVICLFSVYETKIKLKIMQNNKGSGVDAGRGRATALGVGCG